MFMTFIKKLIRFLNFITTLGGRTTKTETQFLRFGTSSSFTLMIDLLLFVFFVETLQIYYLTAAGLSFLISSSINYFINRNWSFKGTITGFLEGYFLFVFFSIIGVVITVALMWVFVELISIDYLVSRILSAIIEGVITFIINLIFTFKMPHDVATVGKAT